MNTVDSLHTYSTEVLGKFLATIGGKIKTQIVGFLSRRIYNMEQGGGCISYLYSHKLNLH